MSYEDQLIREMTTDQGLPEPEDPNERKETDGAKWDDPVCWICENETCENCGRKLRDCNGNCIFTPARTLIYLKP